jgi:hypothetical protein
MRVVVVMSHSVERAVASDWDRLRNATVAATARRQNSATSTGVSPLRRHERWPHVLNAQIPVIRQRRVEWVKPIRSGRLSIAV